MSSTSVEKFLKSLCRPPDGTYGGPGTPESWWDQFNINWGFTIYRTFYGQGSDEQWRKLLLKITSGAKHEIEALNGGPDRALAETKVQNLFQIDAQSDPSLEGKTMEEMRQLHLDKWGGPPASTAIRSWRVFLLADERVLAGSELEVINVVAADYDPIAAVPRSWRAGPQRWFGWVTSTFKLQ